MNGPSEKMSLSVGELAFALGVQYSGEAALNVVQRQFGFPDDKDADLVLAASGQSLLARELLLEGEGDEYELSPPLGDALRRLYEATRTIICHRSSAGEAAYVAFHLGPAGPVKHWVRGETVHELEVLPDVGAAAGAAAGFFSAPIRVVEDIPPVRMRQSLADQLLPSEDRAFIESELPSPYVAEETRRALVEDILGCTFRGSIVRVEHHEDGTSLMTPRFFLLRGATRLWLMRPYLLGADWFIEFSVAARDAVGQAFLVTVQEPESSE